MIKPVLHVKRESNTEPLDDGFKPSSNDGKKVDEDPSKGSECKDQENQDNVNNTNNVNTVSSTVNTADTNDYNELPFDPNMPALEDVGTFDLSNEDEDDDEVANMYNLDTAIQVSPTPTTRIHKDHPLDQVIGDLHSATQIRNMIKNLEEHGNKKDERGIVIRNKARLVAQGHTHEEGIDYDEVFALVARIEAIGLFLSYASFKDFVVYQMDVKSAFLYAKIKKEVYVCQPPGFEDLDFPARVYKVEKALYGLHQTPRAWFTEVKNASTPMKTQKPLFKDEDGEEVDVYMYRSDHRLADEKGVDCLPNSTIFENLKLMGKPKRKNTQVPQPSGSTEHVVDEAVYKELDDRLVRAATTAFSLEAEHDIGNIDKTQSKAIPNEASSSGTTSGGSPRCQDTMRIQLLKLGKYCKPSRTPWCIKGGPGA
nr:putative ribonuclease H-like domain-containing protein [Tanacetum cinerariifolium]